MFDLSKNCWRALDDTSYYATSASRHDHKYSVKNSLLHELTSEIKTHRTMTSHPVVFTSIYLYHKVSYISEFSYMLYPGPLLTLPGKV